MRIHRIAALASIALLVSGCGATQPPQALLTPPSAAYSGVTFVDDLDFGAPDGVRLDVCLPEDRGTETLPAIISVHGGGWTRGDKSQALWRNTCAWLASEGFVVFQTNYRLAPAHTYPAAIDDVTTAVRWIRAEAQTQRFGHDPARLGAFGDSAGGNLVSLLGTRGEGDLHTGDRVAAVVELSAPIDLTRAGTRLGELSPSFQRVQLDYLGCESYADCDHAEAASPGSHVDATDPPFYILHSTDEFIPIEQAEAFASALDAAEVDVTLQVVDGRQHALGILDADLRASIGNWLRQQLTPIN